MGIEFIKFTENVVLSLENDSGVKHVQSWDAKHMKGHKVEDRVSGVLITSTATGRWVMIPWGQVSYVHGHSQSTTDTA